MTFEEFKAEYVNDAILNVDLEKENIIIYNILEETRLKAEHSELPNAKKEVREFCEKHLPIVEKRIFQAFRDRRTPEMYKNHVAPFLIDLKVYYSYVNILSGLLEDDFIPTTTETQQIKSKKKNSKVGRPPAIPKPAHKYLKVKEDNKEYFLEKLRDAFVNTPKGFSYFLIALFEMGLLEVEYQNVVFQSFKNFYGGNCGTAQNFNKHWNNDKDKTLIKATKDKISSIKLKNVII
ncbi:hypothetical protein [Bizionia paragorgiae]|uniref:hypothetical protein n=1 Tax=Bizionia paragorgiae TaxID=283786 RepID=UPI003A9137F2